MINRHNFPNLPKHVRLVLLTCDSLLEGLAIWIAVTLIAPLAGLGWFLFETRNTLINLGDLSMNDDKGPVLLAKLAGLLALVGVSSWSDATAVVSFVLGASMLVRFYWRNVWRGFFESLGLIKPKPPARAPRRSTDPEDSDYTPLQ